MSTTFTFDEWGFEKQNGYYTNANAYTKLVMPVNDCARACEQETDCKSITYWTSPTLGGGNHEQCFLNNTPIADSGSITSSSTKISYKKGAKTKSTNIETRIKSKPLWPSIEIAGRDDVIKYVQANVPENFQESPLYENWRPGSGDGCHSTTTNSQYPTAYQAAADGHDGHNRSCFMVIPSSSSCPLPGVVTTAYVSNEEGTATGAGAGELGLYNTRMMCDYKSLDPTWVKKSWDLLENFIKPDNDKLYIKNAKKDYCNSLSSKDLSSDDKCIKFYTEENDTTAYNSLILNKLKSESNWWNDATNCSNFRNVINGKKNDQAIIRVAEEVIKALPNTGWSDDLSRALNSVRMEVDGLLGTIDTKVEEYCKASNGDTNVKCSCRNAIKYGENGCVDTIQGCTDVKKYSDIMKEIKDIDNQLGTKLENIYEPRYDSESCKNALNPTSTILGVGRMQVRNFDIASCITAFDNSGKIEGDVSIKCAATVNRYDSSQSSSSEGGGSSSSSDSSSGDKIFVSGETAGIKNDYWIIGLCLFCLCFLIVGVSAAAVFIKSSKP